MATSTEVMPTGGGGAESRPRSASSAFAPAAITVGSAAAAMRIRRRRCVRRAGPANPPSLNPRNDKPPREPEGAKRPSGQRTDRLLPPRRRESAVEQAYEMFAGKSLTLIRADAGRKDGEIQYMGALVSGRNNMYETRPARLAAAAQGESKKNSARRVTAGQRIRPRMSLTASMLGRAMARAFSAPSARTWST